MAPLLEIHPTDESSGKSQYQEIHFSGNDTIAKNDKTPLGLVVDSYIHHTLVDSFGEFLVADVQGAGNCSWIQKVHINYLTDRCTVPQWQSVSI